MKKLGYKLYLICFLFVAVLLLLYINESSAQSNILKKITWHDPWIHDQFGGHISCSNFFTYDENGFEIKITKNDPTVKFYGIQVISNNPVPLDNKKYLLKCEVFSSKECRVYFNIQTNNINNLNRVIPDNYIFPISATGNYESYSVEFQGNKSKGRLLHFKLGKLPADTVFKIKNISIQAVKYYGFTEDGTFFIHEDCVREVGGNEPILRSARNSWKEISMKKKNSYYTAKVPITKPILREEPYCFRVGKNEFLPHQLYRKDADICWTASDIRWNDPSDTEKGCNYFTTPLSKLPF